MFGEYDKLEQMDKEYVLRTYARNYIHFDHGKNATLYDVKGNDYIDFTSGIGVVSVGHGNKYLADAISNQAHKLIHISNLYLIEPQAKLAKKLSELCGYKVACFFGNSGAEANEAAIKMARKYGQNHFDAKRNKIITLDQSFHGRTITTLKATGQPSMHKEEFSPYPKGFISAKNISDIYNVLDEHKDEVCAVMIELVQGEGGVEVLPKDEVKKLATYLNLNKILLIVDEVQTGVYRTGEFLASNLYGIEPDIVTLAKGLGGGVPIGVAMSKDKGALGVGDHGSTFGGNFLSTTAGLEVLEILEYYHKNQTLNREIATFQEKANDIASRFHHIIQEKVGVGMMVGFRLKNKYKDTLGDIINEASKDGLLILKAGRNTIRLLPPLTITQDETIEGFRRLELVLERF